MDTSNPADAYTTPQLVNALRAFEPHLGKLTPDQRTARAWIIQAIEARHPAINDQLDRWANNTDDQRTYAAAIIDALNEGGRVNTPTAEVFPSNPQRVLLTTAPGTIGRRTLTPQQATDLAHQLIIAANAARTAANIDACHPTALADYQHYRSAGGTADWPTWWARYAPDYQ